MFFSFIVSGAEVAYFSLTHKEINLLKTKQQPAYKECSTCWNILSSLLASLLMANTFTNISIIIISNILLDGFFDAGSFIAFLAKFVL